MKLKCRPEDFRVEEKLKLRLKSHGRYSIYRLEKKLWNTLDVIRELERRHRMRWIGRAGLKDRYSQSTQFLSIKGKGPKSITEENYKLQLAGMSDEPVSRDVLLGNRFTITIRALTDPEVETAKSRLPLVEKYGMPNYYDDQRFGSARHGKGFIARSLIDGHCNGALKLWLAIPSAADDSRTRRTHKLLKGNWGDWQRCRALAPPDAKAALNHLVRHPKEFKHAAQLIPRSLLELFVNAYQSWLWNETAAGVLTRLGIPSRALDYSVGTFLFYEKPAPNHHRYLRKLIIPALGPRARFVSDRVARVAGELLAREGLELGGLKLPFHLRGLFFKPWDRSAIVIPQRLQVAPPRKDDLYPGRRKLTLSFFLPGGSYATLIIKRLFMT